MNRFPTGTPTNLLSFPKCKNRSSIKQQPNYPIQSRCLVDVALDRHNQQVIGPCEDSCCVQETLHVLLQKFENVKKILKNHTQRSDAFSPAKFVDNIVSRLNTHKKERANCSTFWLPALILLTMMCGITDAAVCTNTDAQLENSVSCDFINCVDFQSHTARERLDDTEVCDRGAAVTALEHSSNDVCKCYSLNDDVKMEANVVETVSNVCCFIFYLLYQQINIFTDNFFFLFSFFTLGFYIY